MRTLNLTEFVLKQNAGEACQVIDARSENEFQTGHIPETLNFFLERVSEKANELDRETLTVLVCESGARAKSAYRLLAERLPSLVVLEGGTSGWNSLNHACATEVSAVWNIERQIRFTAGCLVFTGAFVGLFWRPANLLALFVGGGLVVTALINWCGMGILLGKLPWNRNQR